MGRAKLAEVPSYTVTHFVKDGSLLRVREAQQLWINSKHNIVQKRLGVYS